MTTATVPDLPRTSFLPHHGGPSPATQPISSLTRKLDALRELAIFEGVPDAGLSVLATASLLRRFSRGQTIVQLGNKNDCVLLTQGRAKTLMGQATSCSELTLSTFEAGDIIAETCWTAGQTATEGRADALSECEALFIPRRALDSLFERHGHIAVRFLGVIATKLQQLTNLSTRRACLDVADRLYCKLADLAETQGQLTHGGLLIEHGLYQNELASSIGASREAVNRQLAAWKEKGLVSPGRRVVLVRDPIGLKMAVSLAARSLELNIGVDGANPDGRATA